MHFAFDAKKKKPEPTTFQRYEEAMHSARQCYWQSATRVRMHVARDALRRRLLALHRRATSLALHVTVEIYIIKKNYLLFIVHTHMYNEKKREFNFQICSLPWVATKMPQTTQLTRVRQAPAASSARPWLDRLSTVRRRRHRSSSSTTTIARHTTQYCFEWPLQKLVDCRWWTELKFQKLKKRGVVYFFKNNSCHKYLKMKQPKKKKITLIIPDDHRKYKRNVHFERNNTRDRSCCWLAPCTARQVHEQSLRDTTCREQYLRRAIAVLIRQATSELQQSISMHAHTHTRR